MWWWNSLRPLGWLSGISPQKYQCRHSYRCHHEDKVFLWGLNGIATAMKQWSWDDQGFGYDVLSLTKNLIQIKQIWSKMVLILPNVIISPSLPICVPGPACHLYSSVYRTIRIIIIYQWKPKNCTAYSVTSGYSLEIFIRLLLSDRSFYIMSFKIQITCNFKSQH